MKLQLRYRTNYLRHLSIALDSKEGPSIFSIHQDVLNKNTSGDLGNGASIKPPKKIEAPKEEIAR